MTDIDLKSCAIAFRADMWDVEEWKKRNEVDPISFQDFLKLSEEYMAARAPSPYIE